jgi:hypothetical protein
MQLDADSTRFATEPVESAGECVTNEEVLVTDSRDGLSPAQMVKRKLEALLENTSFPLDQQAVRGPHRPVP